MTEKRFTLVDDDFISRIKDNGISMTAREIVECLNDLHEENMCLKGEVAHYKLILMGLKKEAKRITERWKCRD